MNEQAYTDAVIKAHETGDISQLKEFGKGMDRRTAEMERQLSPQASTAKEADAACTGKKKTTRGQGRVYLRGSTWWISYSKRGHEFRESAHTTDEGKAKKFLNWRLKEREKPTFVGPKEERLTLDDLEAKILADYRKHNRRSACNVTHCLKRVRKCFGFDSLVDITASRIDLYQEARLSEGAARSTINREVACLRHGFKLLVQDKALSEAPVIKLLEGENVRQGFTEVSDFYSVIDNLYRTVHPSVKDVLEFLYHSGWRSKEVTKLEWQDVDVEGGMVRLRRKVRMLPLIGELQNIIERRLIDRRMDCPLVFHRNGKPVKSFRKAWETACKAIGQPDLVPHDMRRSATRNFRKAGLSENEGMAMTGHQTNSIYRRYDIIDEEDMKQSMEKVQTFLKGQPRRSKVAPIRKAG